MLDGMTSVRVHCWDNRGVHLDKRGKPAYAPGHVALEIRQGAVIVVYASFWPGNSCPITICKESDAHFHNLDTDQLIEAKTERIHTIVGLDVEAMIRAFDRFKRKPKSWGALGSGVLRRPYQRNCAGLTLHLLEKGGLREILNNQAFMSSRFKVLLGVATSTVFLACASLGIRREILRLYTDPIPGAEAFEKLNIHNIPSPMQTFGNFIGDFNHHVEISEEAFGYIKNIFANTIKAQQQATELSNGSVTLFKEISQVGQLTHELLVDFSTVTQKNGRVVMPLLLETYMSVKSHISYAATATLVPIAISAGIIFFNMVLWAKTMTPADVEKIVIRAVQIQCETRK